MYIRYCFLHAATYAPRSRLQHIVYCINNQGRIWEKKGREGLGQKNLFYLHTDMSYRFTYVPIHSVRALARIPEYKLASSMFSIDTNQYALTVYFSNNKKKKKPLMFFYNIFFLRFLTNQRWIIIFCFLSNNLYRLSEILRLSTQLHHTLSNISSASRERSFSTICCQFEI